MSVQDTQDTYQFGEWLVEPNLNRLSNNGVQRQLEPRTMDVLECILSRAGEVVATDELLDSVWAGRHAEPHMVAKRVSQIRQALGDDAKDPAYIATVSKRGYRTIAPVNLINDAVAVRRATGPTEVEQVLSVPTQRHRPALKAGALIVILGLSGWIGLTIFGQRSNDQIRSVAVLPLDNFSGDPSQQYVADGMTEEIITELAKLSQLRVISRTSVMRYRTERPSLKEIGKNLGVDTIIEGSVAREQGRFRVTIQLIDARTDSHIWADSFDRDVSSVLALRTDVAREIASQLNLGLSSDELSTLQISRTIDEAAYDAYLRGLSEIRESPQFAEWAPRATEELARAVALDPNFAQAWAKLALIKTIEAVWISRDHFVAVRDYAEKALSIDSRLAAAHTALGYVRLLNDWDPSGADTAFRRAVQLSPNDPSALQGFLINLQTQERTEEALRVSRQLLRISPSDFTQRADRVTQLYNLRLFVSVLKEADGVRVLEPGFHSSDETAAYHRLGRFEDSFRSRIAAYRRCGAACDQVRAAAERGWEEGGYEGTLRAMLEQELQENSPRRLYWVHAQLGELDAAFARLERVVESRAPWLVGIRYHPDYDALRLDPRFDGLLERIGLPTLSENPARTADVGRLMAFRGRAPEAIEHLYRAIAASPEDPRTPRWLESLAWAQFAAVDYKQAARWAERALEHDVSRHAAAFAHLLRASSYAQLGQLDTARSALQDAQKFWPNTLRVDRDLRPLFLGGDQDMRDRYIAGLRKAGLAT